MATGFFDVQVARQRAELDAATQAQNAARLGFSQHKIQSTGLGSVRRPQPIIFDVVFLEEPLFTQGASLISKPNTLPDPMASAGVWQWHRNEKGHYIGAYIYLAVSVGEVFFEASGVGGVSMTHHLLFQGVAYKDLGQRVTTQAQMLRARPVGFGTK